MQHPGTSLSDVSYDPAMTRFFKAQLESLDRSHGVVLDGYPATQDQAEDLEEACAAFHQHGPRKPGNSRFLTMRCRSASPLPAPPPRRNRKMQQRLKATIIASSHAVAYFFPKATIVKDRQNQAHRCRLE